MIYVDNVHPSLRKSYSSIDEDDQETGMLNEFSKGVGAGVDQLQGLIGGGGQALAGSLFGNDEWFVDGMSYYEEQMNEAAQNQADVGRFEDIEGFGDMLNYSAFIVGNVVPSLIGGGGAGLVGGAIAKGGLKKIANTALSTIIKPNAQKLAKQQSAKAFSATQAGREIAGKQAGIGRAVGAMAFGTAAGAGESFTRILEETGEEAPLVALATGIASGSLDALTPMRVLKRVVPAERYKDIAEKVGESVASNSSMKMRMLKEAGKTAGIEGATEMMQEIVQNSTLEVVRGLGADLESSWVERMTTEDKMSQYMNAAIAGAIGGAAIGGVSGIAKNPTKIEREPATEAPTVSDVPVPATLEENPAQGRIDAQQNVADQVANRQGRGNTAPMTIEEARAKAQDLPSARETSSDPAVQRQEAQRVIRDQIAGMAGIRRQVKGIYRQEELGALGETTRIPAEKPAPIATPEEVPFGGNLPENITPPLDALVGTDVDYAGNKGLLGKNDQGYFVATQDNGDVFIESGEYQTLADLGVTPLSGDLEFQNDLVVDPETKKFQLRGEEFTLTRIIKDAQGQALSLAVRDSRGKRKTIRTKEIVKRIESQLATAPDFSQVKVELDELPVDIQQAIVEQSDPESIPDEVTAQEALDVASTLPNADQLTTALNESFQINLPKGDVDTSTPMQYNQTIRRPSLLTPLSEAVKDINQSQGSNRSAIDEARIDRLFDGSYDGPIPLEDGGELMPINMLDGIESPEGMSAQIRDEVKVALLDLIEAGMPKSVLKDISGIYIHSQGAFARETDGAFFPSTGALSLSHLNLVNLVTESDNNNNRAGAFRYVLAHELGHAHDISRSLSETAPEFEIVMDGITSEGVELQVGSILNELGRNYQNSTELGLEMSYPFGDAWFMLNDNPTDVDDIIGVLQKEAFAQAFAVFHSSPELLQQSAPLTYNYFKKLLQTPKESQNDGKANTQAQETDTQVAGVRADVRPQTVSGSEQVQDGSGAGEDGRGSAVAEEASEGLGEQGQPQDGDDSGQSVQPKEDTAEPEKGTPPTVKRAENFASEGEYDVTTSDGTVYKIYRDASQFSSPHWHLNDEFYDSLGFNSASSVRTQGIGSTRKEAVEWVDRNHTSAMQKEDTAQEIEEERLAEERMIAIEADFNDDGPLFAPFTRVPEVDEQSPVLPMGKVEQSLSDLLAQNPNPTSEQLGSIVGAPKKRKGKEAVQDVDVRPITLDELRGYVKDSLSKSDNLKWYDEFGNLFRNLVGDANLDEASVIFGVTSAQNAAENNLAETLHIMSLARKFDPVKQRKQFELAVKATPRPDGQKLKITGKQVTAIGDLYANGDFEGGIKTTTYMQMVQDRGRNAYNPFSVQDVHMSRVFGFRKKDFDKKSGALVDAAKVSGENEYRYAQYLTSVLADEFGMSPNQMQATLWFYAKDKLTPKNKGDEAKAKRRLEKLKKKAKAEGKEFDINAPRYGDGTPASSALYAAPEIQVIKNMITDGTFEKATPIADSLTDGIRPRNKPAQKTTPFSTVNEREGLMDLARARSPKLIASAVAGKGRGLAFPDGTPIETLVQYNQDIMAAIVDDGGQIPLLRELGIPHEIEESAGTFTGYEPSIMIRLLGGNLETANKLAPLLGDALLQDSVITSQAVYGDIGLPAFAVAKKDGSDFSREDAMILTESLNPDQDPDGINFNQPMSDTLMFLDSRSMKENFEYTELQAEEFYSTLINELGDDYSVGIVNTQGDYHGSDQYREAIEKAWNRETPSGSQNIYDRTNASLYEPVREVYNEYAEKLGIPKREAQSLKPLSAPPSLFSRGVKQDPSAATFSGKMDTKHGYRYDPRDGDAPIPNFVASKDFKGVRYDGDGGTFGSDGVYLEDASAPAFFMQKSMYQFMPQRRVDVEVNFKKAFVFTPATVQELKSVLGIHPKDVKGSDNGDLFIGRGAKIVNLLKEQGYDGLIVKDFKSTEMSDYKESQKQLKREGMGAFDDELVQPQVFAFYPENLKVKSGSMVLAKDFLLAPPSRAFNPNETLGWTSQDLLEKGDLRGAMNSLSLHSDNKAVRTIASKLAEVTNNRQNLPAAREATKRSKVKSIVYHGSPQTNITEFKAGDVSQGLYFSPDRNLSEMYMSGLIGSGSSPSSSGKGRVYEVMLDIRNPLVLQSEDQLTFIEKIPVALGRKTKNEVVSAKNAKQLMGADVITSMVLTKSEIVSLKAQGYDGIMNDYRSEYVVFDSSQIHIVDSGKGGTQVQVVDGLKTAGSFNPKTNTIQLDSSRGINEHTLLHEMTHAATSATLFDQSHPLTKELTKLFGEVKPFLGNEYGITNLDEFVAEGMSNEQFRDKLDTITLKGTEGSALQRFFDSVISFLRNLVDIQANESAQTEFDSLVAAILAPAPMSRDATTQALPRKDDASSSNILFSPTRSASDILTNDELIDSVRASTGGRDAINSAKNKSIKGIYKGAQKGLAGWAQKNLSSRGLLPQTAFDSMIERDGQFGAVEIDIRQLVGHYDLAIEEAYGDDISKAVGLDEALNTPVSELPSLGLAKNVQDAVAAMRTYIDGLSVDYAEILNQDIERLRSEGNDEATAKSEILGIVVNNMGRYANRSFRAFDDPNWNEAVPEQVILDAREYLASNGTVNPDQVINTILKEGTAFDDMGSFIAESKLGAKDLSILKKRQDIAPEIRALLGEYKDPRINFARSATKMSRLIYNDKFLKQVLVNGLDTFLFNQEDAPVNATKRIAEIGSKSMNPLNGYYTFPEVEQAFRDALDAQKLNGLYKTIVQINGAVKYGKTIIAPTTVSRNWMSASMFTIANGHFNWSKIGKSLEVTGSYFRGMGDQVAYLKRIKQLGVVYDNPYAGEMIKLLEDSNIDNLINPDGKIKGFFDGATRFYQYGDDFWKIVGFENEVQNFMELKGDSREAAEVKAAERIRDTYPTYSLIGALPRKLRQFPLLGTFVSFPAEIIRTQANMLKYLRQDLADPDMRPAALKRMAGMAMMSAGVYAAQAMAMSAFDVSEEEEEAIKLMAAPWAKNSNILVTGRDEKGRLEYLDLTHLDPYALYKRPLNAIMRDQPAGEAILDASWEIMKPFLGWDISTATILQHINNEKASGSQIYNPADTFTNNVVDVYEHYEKGMGPSFLQNARRMEKALSGEVSGSGKAYDVGDEMGALIGFRKTTFDPKTALHFKAYEFNEAKRNSTSLLTSSFRDPNGVSDGNLRDAFQRASDARKQAFKDMSKLVSASVSSGISPTQAMVILRSNGVTQKDAKALVTGGESAWTMSDSTLKNSISKSDLLFGKGTSQVFSKRWAMIQKWLAEES